MEAVFQSIIQSVKAFLGVAWEGALTGNFFLRRAVAILVIAIVLSFGAATGGWWFFGAALFTCYILAKHGVANIVRFAGWVGCVFLVTSVIFKGLGFIPDSLIPKIGELSGSLRSWVTLLSPAGVLVGILWFAPIIPVALLFFKKSRGFGRWMLTAAGFWVLVGVVLWMLPVERDPILGVVIIISGGAFALFALGASFGWATRVAKFVTLVFFLGAIGTLFFLDHAEGMTRKEVVEKAAAYVKDQWDEDKRVEAARSEPQGSAIIDKGDHYEIWLGDNDELEEFIIPVRSDRPTKDIVIKSEFDGIVLDSVPENVGFGVTPFGEKPRFISAKTMKFGWEWVEIFMNRNPFQLQGTDRCTAVRIKLTRL
jgi:hypothetical protein